MASALVGNGIDREAGGLLGGGIYRPSIVPISGGLGREVHPDYVFAFLSDSLFYVSDNPPLKWSVTRKDGQTPGAPTAATIKVWTSLNVLQPALMPDIDPSPPARTLVLAADWPILAAGAYIVQLTVTMPGDGQIRSDREVVLVR